MKTIIYDDISSLLDALRGLIQEILGTKFIGFYLYGSLVTGDFDYKTSDIDLLAAIASDLTDEEFTSLKTMQDDFVKIHPQWNDRIEIAYVPLNALKTFKTKKSKIAIISPGEPFHRKDAGKDWLMNWYIVREQSMTLLGPSPTTIITFISKDEFTQAVKEHAIMWREWVEGTKDSRPFQAYAILTVCRAFYSFQHGEQVSKNKAAVWIEEKFPQWSTLVKNALLWRKIGLDKHIKDEETYPETKEFVNFIIDQFDVSIE